VRLRGVAVGEGARGEGPGEAGFRMLQLATARIFSKEEMPASGNATFDSLGTFP